jgi:plasmid stabilization system protein ParE
MNHNYKLKYSPDAKRGFKEARNWYGKVSVNLMNRFSDAVSKAFDEIKKTPKAYSIRYSNIRITHPESFPYNIHFYINEETIVIVAILHNKRNQSSAALTIGS